MHIYSRIRMISRPKLWYTIEKQCAIAYSISDSGLRKEKHMKTTREKIGLGIIIFGVIALVLGIIMGMTVGTYLVPVFIGSSVVINTIGVTLLQQGRKK